MGIRNNTPGRSSCEVCGENQEACFDVYLGGERHVFDSFECAIRGLMPRCSLCGGLILGLRVQVNSLFYCSDPCASLSVIPSSIAESHYR